MTITVRRYRPEDRAAVDRLNARLGAADIGHRVDVEGPEARAFDPTRPPPVSGRLFVAADGDEIRGAVWLHEQGFWVDGKKIRAGWARLPLAESLVDATYRGVPASLLLALQREQPYLMALGMGHPTSPFARLLAALGWRGEAIPFFFRMLRPFRVLRGLTFLRRTWRGRLAADAVAWSGLGSLGAAAVGLIRGRSPGLAGVAVERVGAFDGWADAVWENAKPEYEFAGVRDHGTLNRLLPAGDQGLTRLRVRRRGDDLGWIAVLRSEAAAGDPDPHFGRLAVGLLADGMARGYHVSTLVTAGVRELRELGVDLAVSFQRHAAWTRALSDAAFLPGPSNFYWYRSPALARLFSAERLTAAHVNRGDCDGPRWR